jgi:ubiquinone/menaquinone biosynthesis C-methylase UbiE
MEFMVRRRIPEEMDRFDIALFDHVHALRSLNRVNRILGVDRRLGRCLKDFGAAGHSILDLGCGGGGFLTYLSMRDWCGSPYLLLGLDRSAHALRCARAWSVEPIRWISGDARNLPFADDGIDVVTCSLFLHHFDAEDAVGILREAARVARRGIVVGDLVRSRTAWALTWLMTRLLSRSWIVHVDGPRSVRAAFRPEELSQLAQRAGLTGAIVERRFPFRMILRWLKC